MQQRNYESSTCSHICYKRKESEWTGKRVDNFFPIQYPVIASKPTTASRRYTAYLFMCRWTCSRCWRLAETLGTLEPWLNTHKIRIVMVGQRRFLPQAKKLARELQIPFKLIADDHHIFSNIFGLHQQKMHTHHLPTVLADNVGRVCYWSRLPVRSKRHFMEEISSAIQGFEAC